MIPARKPDADPVQTKLFKNDRALREDMGTMTDFAHRTTKQLLDACDTVERLSHSPSLLNRAKTMRELAGSQTTIKGAKP